MVPEKLSVGPQVLARASQSLVLFHAERERLPNKHEELDKEKEEERGGTVDEGKGGLEVRRRVRGSEVKEGKRKLGEGREGGE